MYVCVCMCVCLCVHIYIYMYIYRVSKEKLATVVESDRMLPFQQLLHQGVEEGATPFPGLLHFTLDTYLILPSVKQGGIKYHF